MQLLRALCTQVWGDILTYRAAMARKPIKNIDFEHVLHSYGLHLVSTYKYEIGNYYFYFISYLLDNHLSSLELK
jgi:hypothetical protein